LSPQANYTDRLSGTCSVTLNKKKCDSSLKATFFLSSVVHDLYLFAHANRFCFLAGVNNCFLIVFFWEGKKTNQKAIVDTL
jgi:hypothetical protein